MAEGSFRMKTLAGNRNKKRNKGGFKGKKYAIYDLMKENTKTEMTTHEIYIDYNTKYSRKGVTMYELANILSRSPMFDKLEEMGVGSYERKSFRKRVALWKVVE
jgi:hypothetical protein